ncbi:tRNA1(Val) (adenine(37)-N6)-methyltransferase [Terrihabitans soli]|nr:methyltransferase [Terrihabitans soli]
MTTTKDLILGDRLILNQPARGHRAGSDAVLVAAAVPIKPGEVLADFGAGVGSAGLAVLMRVPDAQGVLIEIDPDLAELAAINIAENGLNARVVTGDVASLGKDLEAGLTVDHIVSNPPYNAPGGRAPADEKTARARIAPEGMLEDWMRAAMRILSPGGTITFIHRPEAQAEILAALGNRFGGVVLRFVHGSADVPAIRVIVQARKARRAPLRVLPPLILNAGEGAFTPEAEALHRDLAALDMG